VTVRVVSRVGGVIVELGVVSESIWHISSISLDGFGFLRLLIR